VTAFIFRRLIQIQIIKIAREEKKASLPLFFGYFLISILILIFFLQYWMGNSSSSMTAPSVVNATARHTASVSY
jgi:hypothetical protein